MYIYINLLFIDLLQFTSKLLWHKSTGHDESHTCHAPPASYCDAQTEGAIFPRSIFFEGSPSLVLKRVSLTKPASERATKEHVPWMRPRPCREDTKTWEHLKT